MRPNFAGECGLFCRVRHRGMKIGGRQCFRSRRMRGRGFGGRRVRDISRDYGYLRRVRRRRRNSTGRCGRFCYRRRRGRGFASGRRSGFGWRRGRGFGGRDFGRWRGRDLGSDGRGDKNVFASLALYLAPDLTLGYLEFPHALWTRDDHGWHGVVRSVSRQAADKNSRAKGGNKSIVTALAGREVPIRYLHSFRIVTSSHAFEY